MTTQKPQQLSIWERRWLALKASIENYEASLKGDSTISALKSMLGNLREFAERQFYFFHNGLVTDDNLINTSHTKYTLTPSSKYPSDYVFGVTLKQIAYDLEVIQRAAEQRIWASQENSTKINETLAMADFIAKVALAQAYKPGLSAITGRPPTVITYFEKSPGVRCFPYDDVALIAIPFTCVPHSGNLTSENAQDYVPILHELGHCVFWYGSVEGGKVPIHKALNQALIDVRENAPWCYRWVEEIFADVFGCIIGGPVIALSAQDLASVASEKEFTKDDGEHPIPAIRSIIYTNILQRFTQPSTQQLTTKLKERWRNQQRERFQHKSETEKNEKTSSQVPDETYFEKGEFTVFEEQSTQDSWQCVVKRVSFAEATVKINEVINKIIEQVFKNDSALEQIFDGFWKDSTFPNLTEKDDPKRLYTSFENHMGKLFEAKSSQSELLADIAAMSFDSATGRTPARPKSWEDWMKTNDFLEKTLSGYEEGGEAIPVIDESKKVKGRTGWLNVLYADGWATKGPTNNPSVK